MRTMKAFFVAFALSLGASQVQARPLSVARNCVPFQQKALARINLRGYLSAEDYTAALRVCSAGALQAFLKIVSNPYYTSRALLSWSAIRNVYGYNMFRLYYRTGLLTPRQTLLNDQ